MLIQIDKLKRQPRQIAIDEQAVDFSVLRDLFDQGTVVFEEKIYGTLEAIRVGDIIEVSGCLKTRVTTFCRRCLVPVTDQIELPVLLCYAEVNDDVPAAEVIEIQPEELGLIPFSGDEIDLRPDLEQELVMAIPQQSLCHDACQGLCPMCGKNLNQGQCECEPPVFHAGLAALKNFKI